MVDEAVQGHLQKMNESITLNNTVNELKNNHRMEDAEIREFLEFATQPKEAVGLNNLVKLWRDASGQTSNVSAKNSLQAVKAAKALLVHQVHYQANSLSVKRKLILRGKK